MNKFKTSTGFTLSHLDLIYRISYDGEVIIAEGLSYTQEVPATDEDYTQLMRVLTGL